MSAENAVELAALRVEVHHLTEAVGEMKGEVASLTAQANRWRGGFLVVLAFGGLLGWIASYLTQWFPR